MRERFTRVALGAALLLAARVAAADPGAPAPPPSPQPAPVYNIYVLAPPPVVPLGEHLHEGFFLRMALGFGYFHDRARLNPSGVGTDAAIPAAGTGAEFSMGGSLSQGFVLGGALLTETAVSPTIHYDDGSPPSSAR